MNEKKLRAHVDQAIADAQPRALGWTPAIYSSQGVPDYAGNPLIEALPPIRRRDEMLAAMRRGRPATDAVRALPAEERMHVAAGLKDVFQPLGRNLELFSSMDIVLRRGYVGRDPLSAGFWNTDALLDRVAAFQTRGTGAAARDQALGLSLIGPSGLGKTQAMKVVVGSYPSIILHEAYEGRPFRFLQIPWLLVNTPSDGSTRNLLPLVFLAIDQLTGVTDYVGMSASQGATEQKMLVGLYRIAHLHAIGGLIFDETQNLNQAKSGGAEKMMNFYTVLANVLRIPVLLIGDETTLDVAAGAMRQARRSSGIGLPLFERLSLDREFELLCRTLWSCLVLREPGPLLPIHVAILHDLSQGFPDMVAKLLISAQQTALMNGIEDIAEGILRDAYERKLPLMQRFMDARRGAKGPLDETLLAEVLADPGPRTARDVCAQPQPARPEPAAALAAKAVARTKRVGRRTRAGAGAGAAERAPKPAQAVLERADEGEFWDLGHEVAAV